MRQRSVLWRVIKIKYIHFQTLDMPQTRQLAVIMFADIVGYTL
jgi:class 3 adenylate cyclase